MAQQNSTHLRELRGGVFIIYVYENHKIQNLINRRIRLSMRNLRNSRNQCAAANGRTYAVLPYQAGWQTECNL